MCGLFELTPGHAKSIPSGLLLGGSYLRAVSAQATNRESNRVFPAHRLCGINDERKAGAFDPEGIVHRRITVAELSSKNESVRVYRRVCALQSMAISNLTIRKTRSEQGFFNSKP
jgi:hypothetical protein